MNLTETMKAAGRRRGRCDRIRFLIALVNAPVGIKRPREQIMEELQRLVDEEAVASSWTE